MIMKISRIFNNIFVKNLLLAIVIFLVLIFGVLWWLDNYTNHGEQVKVPDVKGMQISEASTFFQQKGLKYEVIDSTFVKNRIPGSILETVPPIGTNVKPGRTIYVTINAYTAQLLVIPSVQDMSQRQALAILRSLGFENVEIKMISGAYKDLVMGLESNGKSLEAGDRIPSNSYLYLLVSMGNVENNFDNQENFQDSTTVDESWF